MIGNIQHYFNSYKSSTHSLLQLNLLLFKMVTKKWKLPLANDDSYWNTLASTGFLDFEEFNPFEEEDMKPGGLASKIYGECFKTSIRGNLPDKIKSAAFQMINKEPVLRGWPTFERLLIKLVLTPIDVVPDLEVKVTGKHRTITSNGPLVSPIIELWVAAQRVFGMGREQTPTREDPSPHEMKLLSASDSDRRFSKEQNGYRNMQEAMVGQKAMFEEGPYLDGVTVLSPNGWMACFNNSVLRGMSEAENHFSSLAKTPPSVLFQSCNLQTNRESESLTVMFNRRDQVQCQWMAARNVFGDWWLKDTLATGDAPAVAQEPTTTTVAMLNVSANKTQDPRGTANIDVPAVTQDAPGVTHQEPMATTVTMPDVPANKTHEGQDIAPAMPPAAETAPAPVQEWKINMASDDKVDLHWNVLLGSRYLGLPEFAPFTHHDMIAGGSAETKLLQALDGHCGDSATQGVPDVDWWTQEVIHKLVLDHTTEPTSLSENHELTDVISKLVFTENTSLDAKAVKVQMVDQQFVITPNPGEIVSPVTKAWIAVKRSFGVGRHRPKQQQNVSKQMVPLPVEGTIPNFNASVDGYKSYLEAKTGWANLRNAYPNSHGSANWLLAPDGWKSLYKKLPFFRNVNAVAHFSAMAKTRPNVIFGRSVKMSDSDLTLKHKQDDTIQCQWLAFTDLFGHCWYSQGDDGTDATVNHQVTVTTATGNDFDAKLGGNKDQDSLQGTSIGSVPGMVSTGDANVLHRLEQLKHVSHAELDETAHELWRSMISQFESAAELYENIVQVGNVRPDLLANLLKIVSPTAKNILVNEADDANVSLVIRAYSTAVFDVIKPTLDGASNEYYEKAVGKAPKSTLIKTFSILKELLGLLHFLLYTYPDRFPDFLQAIRKCNGFQESYKLPPPNFLPQHKPDKLGFPCKMPIAGCKALLRTFGVTHRGDICGKTALVDRISMPDMLIQMQKVNEIFKTRASEESQHLITVEDGTEICKQTLGLHPILWKIASHNKPNVYYEAAAGVEDFVNLDPGMSLATFRRCYQDSNEWVDEIDDGEQMEDGVTDQAIPVCDGYAYMSSALQPEAQPNSGKTKPQKTRKKKTKKRRFGKNPKLACVEQAARLVCDKINKDGRPLDLQLSSGQAIRRAFKLKSRSWDPPREIKATLVKLGDGDAPCVIGIKNALSPELVKLNVRQVNKTPLVLDTHGDADTSCVGSFYHCKVCEGGTNGMVFMGPHMKLGKSNSLVSNPADKYQIMKQDFAAQIMNMFVDSSNSVLQRVAGKDNEPPQKGSVNPQGADALQVEGMTDGDAKNAKKAQMVDIAKKAASVQPPIEQHLSEKQVADAAAKVKQQGGHDAAILRTLEYFPRHNPNTTIVKGGPQPTFSKHQDRQNTMTSDLIVKRNCASNGDVLPLQSDFIVCTTITGTGRVPTRVQWSRASTSMGHVDTDVNGFIHIQLHGANDQNVEHESFVIAEQTSVNDTEEQHAGEEAAETIKIILAPMSYSLHRENEDTKAQACSVTVNVKKDSCLDDLIEILKADGNLYGGGVNVPDGPWEPDHSPLADGYTFAGFAFFRPMTDPGDTPHATGESGLHPMPGRYLPLDTTRQLGKLSIDDGQELLVYMVFAGGNSDEKFLYVKPFSFNEPLKRSFVNGIRLIETQRMVACPCCNPVSYLSGVRDDALIGTDNSSKKPFNTYDKVGIFGTVRDLPNIQPTPITDGTEDPQTVNKLLETRTKPVRVALPKRFPRLDAETLNSMLDWKVEGVEKVRRPPKTVGLSDKTRQKSVKHAALVKHALGQGVIFEVVDIDGHPLKDQPLFMLDGQLIQPGTVVPISRLPFKITNRSMTVVHPDYGCVFLIVHAYKNDPRTFKKAHEVASMFRELDLSVPENRAKFVAACDELKTMQLVMNGFGGSAQKSDTYAVTAKTVQVNDPTYRIGDYQRSDNKETKLFMKAFDEKRPVAVFVVESKWAPTEKDHLKHSFQSKGDGVAAAEPVVQENEQEAQETDDEMEDEETNDEMEDDDNDLADFAMPEDEEGDTKKGAPTKGGEDGSARGKMTFLGYFSPKNYGKEEIQMEDIQEMYAGMPNYLKTETWNISHMNYHPFRFYLKPFFTPEELLEQWDSRAEPPSYAKVTVCDQDNRPFAVPYEELCDYLQENYKGHCGFYDKDGNCLLGDPSKGVPRLKIEHLHNFMFDKKLLSPDDYTKMFESVRDPNVGFVDHKKSRFIFLPDEALNILIHVSGAGSYRQQRKNIMHVDKQGTILAESEINEASQMYCGPLVLKESDLLPDPLRISPLPLPNQDFDVNVQHVAYNNRKLMELSFPHTAGQPWPDHYPKRVEVDHEGRPLSYEKLDLSVENNVILLTHMLLGAVIGRLTGQTLLLNQWENPDYKGVSMPTMGTTKNFTTFLEGCLLSSEEEGKETYRKYTFVQSSQHQKTIPAFNSRSMFLRCIEVLGTNTSSVGFKRVQDHIGRAGKTRKQLSRESLTQLMVNCISDCGNLQLHDNLQFIVNKAVLDVRATLIDFVEDITLEQIHLGWGARQGLECMKLMLGGAFKERFEAFHNRMHALLLAADDNSLIALGYKRILQGGKTHIVSLFSGRHYSMDDSEHILCKIWLTVIHSHQSRNMSKVKAQYNNHTWPLPIVHPCEQQLSPLMVEIWEAYKRVRTLHPYPETVEFYFMDAPARAKKKSDKGDGSEDQNAEDGDDNENLQVEEEMDVEMKEKSKGNTGATNSQTKKKAGAAKRKKTSDTNSRAKKKAHKKK